MRRDSKYFTQYWKLSLLLEVTLSLGSLKCRLKEEFIYWACICKFYVNPECFLKTFSIYTSWFLLKTCLTLWMILQYAFSFPGSFLLLWFLCEFHLCQSSCLCLIATSHVYVNQARFLGFIDWTVFLAAGLQLLYQYYSLL